MSKFMFLINQMITRHSQDLNGMPFCLEWSVLNKKLVQSVFYKCIMIRYQYMMSTLELVIIQDVKNLEKENKTMHSNLLKTVQLVQ